MRRRPVCILCMLLVVFLCVTDWLGFSLIRGNPLPQSVQTWIRKHPESTICGEVVRCRENEDFQSVYLRNTYLIYNSEKVSIDNIKVYLKQKRIIAVTVMLINFWQEVLFWVSGKTGRGAKAPRIRESLTVKHTMAARGSICDEERKDKEAVAESFCIWAVPDRYAAEICRYSGEDLWNGSWSV